jgi:hypothetical protein
MDIFLPHFASQNEVKRCPFKIIIGGASRQMAAAIMFLQFTCMPPRHEISIPTQIFPPSHLCPQKQEA